MPRLIIFANGSVPDLESARQIIRPGDLIFAADGGTRHAFALGLLPSVIIGDLDSLTQEDRDVLDAKGVEFHQHPRNKDQTDLELALDYAIQAGHREILVVGALGGRLDQTLGNLFLLCQPRFSTYDIRFTDGVEEVLFTRDHCVIDGAPGDIVSLIPWGAETTGITSEGLRWSLRDDVLFPDRTRGISNELLGETASVTVGTGLLLIVHRFIK